jgi:hypothetical protein
MLAIVFASALFACFAPPLTLTLNATQQSTTVAKTAEYPVNVEGREVLRIYEGLGSFTAEDRARAATERLHQLIFSPQADTSTITTEDTAHGTEIVLGDRVLLIVTDEDASHFHISRQMLANSLARRIRAAIDTARQQHGKQFLVRAAIYALATLALYLGILWLLITGIRRLLQALRNKSTRIKGIKIQQSEILAGQRVAGLLSTCIRLLRFVLVVLFTWIFLATEFKFFPWTRQHGKQLLD